MSLEARVHQSNRDVVRSMFRDPAATSRDRESEDHLDNGRLYHFRLSPLSLRRPVLRAQAKQAAKEEAEGGTADQREQCQHGAAQQ